MLVCFWGGARFLGGGGDYGGRGFGGEEVALELVVVVSHLQQSSGELFGKRLDEPPPRERGTLGLNTVFGE